MQRNQEQMRLKRSIIHQLNSRSKTIGRAFSLPVFTALLLLVIAPLFDQAKDRPADLGYYIGYKICESYYRNSSNKNQAVRDILEVKDFEQFLSASKYDYKFVFGKT